MHRNKSLLFTALAAASFFSAFPGFCQDEITIPCEVMETSGSLKSSSAKLNGIRYVLLHHANAADRDMLSKWLEENSETEVTFISQGKSYKGMLCRLAHCFGRGLLIYASDVNPVKKDIIDVVLPRSP